MRASRLRQRSRARLPGRRPIGSDRGGAQRLDRAGVVVVGRAVDRRRPPPARSRPPRRPSTTVDGLMPPSTWMSTSRSRRSISARSATIFGTTSSMNFCPEKPGLTVISSTMSRSASTGSTTSIGDAGAERDGGLLPERSDVRDGGRQIGHRLGVHVDEVGARAREVLQVAVGLDDHQVEIERNRRRLADRLHDRGTQRDVRDELAVHDVDVDHVGARRRDRLHLFAQAGKISGENGRRDTQGARH